MLTPYVHRNTEGDSQDRGWYAVDQHGSTAGPYASQEQAEAKLRTLYPEPTPKEQFEQWAKFKCPQFNPSGRYATGGKWVYHHSIQQLLWECWQDKPDTPPPLLVVPNANRVMHEVLNYQQNQRTNVTGTSNWAANIGMVVVRLVEKMNPKQLPTRV
uniref:Uncharacterized protein n=1 Tax=Pseudomonas phage Cygsa01 TaxID=3138529 RepID=A0AAU6W4B9_9VIRU